ncbi:MAG: DUF4292 domain-containing protein [Desulfobulbaceae bacterium]|nr:DUF4292 domain-containing protein [Desulfobulbaceae bacterium]
MHSAKSWNRNYNSTILLILISLVCFGCARKPWTNPLGEKQTENTIQFLELLNSRTESCPKGIDGDLTLYYQNFFGKKSLKGYFQILSPSFVKLIVSNPLGQPVLAVTSDQHTFQLVNTLKRKYITGRVLSYGLFHNIPPALLQGNWKNWARGTITIDPPTITNIRQDREGRGTWVTVQKKADNNPLKTHLLIELEDGNLLSQIIENDTGKVLAKITYEDWVSVGKCKQPHMIKVTGLEYNTELTVRLSDVLTAEDLDKDDFRFTAPAGYMRQIFP